MRGGGEIWEPSPVVKDEVMFVALGKNFRESETVLMYAVQDSRARGMDICILHVHQPAKKIPMMGTKAPVNMMHEYEVKAYHEREREEMHKILDKYIETCRLVKAHAEKLWIEMDSIEKGIVQLIYEHGIKWLVMGAAANKSYSRRMKKLKSKKAIYVNREAPSFCHICFVCNGKVIHTRESKLDEVNRIEDSLFQASPNTESIQSVQSLLITEGPYGRINAQGPILERRFWSDNHWAQRSALSTGASGAIPHYVPEESNNMDVVFRESCSAGSPFSMFSSEINEDLALVPFPKTEGSETGFDLPNLEDLALVPFPKTEGIETGFDLPNFAQADGDTLHSLVASCAIEGDVIDGLIAMIEHYVAEAESSRRELYLESIRSKKAEKDVVDAIHIAEASETMYSQELQSVREIEKSLARSNEEAQQVKRQLCEVKEELRDAHGWKSSLKYQIADSDKMVEELEQKMVSAVDMLKRYKMERDELQVKHDNALGVAEELWKKEHEEASSSSVSQFFSEFSFSDIEEATSNFSQSLKIVEGSYECIYKGNLRHTQVAIKLLNPDSWQGPFKFQQEVNVLSKLRHPNLIALIGACPESWALIYEYLPNGSLEDRLTCKGNAPPLSWQTRIRIAAEICSALIFLHSYHPRGVVHGDLRPDNILLDGNFVSKLSDFGMCHGPPSDKFSGNNMTLYCRTNPSEYVDPEFLSSGELTSKSDVYSFGMILLRLLTGRPALGIAKEVQHALDRGILKDLLDSTAGDWPFVQAKQLAHLALHCSDTNCERRPDLSYEVWRVLEPMRVSCGASSFRFGSKECRQIPSYFLCPIFQEVMQDPVVSADGFTYEAEALKGWLESGHDTSPMTNLKLPHFDVIPNHSLRSAIQEWLQQT